MNFLTPLFLVGALAVALPVVFHLIRRTTKERTIFSSLMFLLPTLPRVTKRSRLEHILLLLLRCLVLGLLALGFARPFIQRAIDNNQPTGPGKHVVLLVDTSASMRRGALWTDALKKVEEHLRRAGPADQVALFTFDHVVNRLVTFEQWSQTDFAGRAPLATRRLGETTPGWYSTHLGNALVTAAEALEDPENKRFAGQRQIVLIGDLQEGSQLDTLQAYEWPRNIELVIEPVKVKRGSNAGLQLVAEAEDTGKKSAETQIRVRVSNASDSQKEQFQIGWALADGKSFAGAAVDVYVPPGQSRVVSAPPPPSGAAVDRLILRGDDDEFDNTVFVISPEAARVNILFLGNDPEKDATQPLYFLQRGFQETRRQVAQVIARRPDAVLLPADMENTPLLVVADVLPEARWPAVRRWLKEEGKTVLILLRSPAMALTLGGVLEVEGLAAGEAPGGGYAMLGEIDFRHPLFAPFADPRFSDFTKIHFWKHRRLDTAKIPGVRVLAKFDNGDAALIETTVGKGKLLVLTAGWQPEDSQLALSSKFVPLLYSLLEQSGAPAARPAQYFVGDTVVLANAGANTNGAATLHKPDGVAVELAKGDALVTQTDQPGIYTVNLPSATQRFAVNLEPNESKTAPLSLDELERLGVPLKYQTPNPAREVEQKRRLLDSEMESKQKLWRWLILAALALLAVETWLAARLSQRSA